MIILDFKRTDETVVLGAQAHLVGLPDDALVHRVGRNRHETEDGDQQHGKPAAADQGAVAFFLQRRTRQQVAQRLVQRQQYLQADQPDRQQQSDVKKLLGHHRQDEPQDAEAISQRQQAVSDKPGRLAGRVGGRYRVAQAEQVTLKQVLPVLARTLEQVGDAERVGEHVVTVVFQQRIAVEK